MAQEVKLMGAIYSDVPSVMLPDSNDTLHPFMDTSDANATASDISTGKSAYVNGVKVIGTNSGGGGGGASNYVTGTFKGTTTGAAMDVTIPYTGNGYPIAAIIYPKDGSYNSNSTFYSLVQRYVFSSVAIMKCVPSASPTYPTGTFTMNDQATVTQEYKSSSSNATSYSARGTTNAGVYGNTDANSTANTTVRFKSNTKMSVFIASTSYGFAANIEYTYHIIYSK